MKVKANINYQDTILKRQVLKDEIIDVDIERAELLLNKEFHGIKFCSLVEENKPKAKKKNATKKQGNSKAI